MRSAKRLPLSIFILCGVFALTAGCSPFLDDKQNTAALVSGLDITMFHEDAFIKKPEIVDCETAQGTKTSCYKLITSGAPAGRQPGPFCPRTISDTAGDGGAWFDKAGSGELVDITGEFILQLGDYYGDEKWMVYNKETNKVRYTATKQACLGAARPDVDPQYMQNCIECELDYLSEDFTLSYLIPVRPIPAEKTSRVRTAGIALDGTELSGPAPINAILNAYTIAAFDDCGGHINEHQGYHYHATTGCTDKPDNINDDHAPLIGYASDGYGIYAMMDVSGHEVEVLDECRGATDNFRGYHYHAASPSENMFIACLHGETVRPVGGPPGGPPPGGHRDGPAGGLPPGN